MGVVDICWEMLDSPADPIEGWQPHLAGQLRMHHGAVGIGVGVRVEVCEA
jgi:hypothetical protein